MTEPHSGADPKHASASRIAVAIAVVLLLAVAYHYRTILSWQTLIDREAQLRDWYRSDALLVLGCALGIYVAMTALSIPGATVLTLGCGWLFGFWPGLAVVSFASAMGATMACALSRTLFREAVSRRWGARLAPIEAAIERDGSWYLLTLRLLPTVPFFLVNLALGLTRYPLRRFYWVSQIGMLPATAVYVYAGSQAVDLRTLSEQGAGALVTPRLIAALCLLGVLPLVLRWVVRRLVRPHEP